MRGEFDFVDDKNLGPAIAEPKFYCAHQACLPVKFLTEFSCRPGSRFWPFAPLKPKHRCAFQVLSRTKQLVRSGAKKPPLKAVLRTAPTRNLATSRLVDPRRSRPRLAMLAFRTRVARTQTRIRLRLSSPGRGQSSLPAWAKN